MERGNGRWRSNGRCTAATLFKVLNKQTEQMLSRRAETAHQSVVGKEGQGQGQGEGEGALQTESKKMA